MEVDGTWSPPGVFPPPLMCSSRTIRLERDQMFHFPRDVNEQPRRLSTTRQLEKQVKILTLSHLLPLSLSEKQVKNSLRGAPGVGDNNFCQKRSTLSSARLPTPLSAKSAEKPSLPRVTWKRPGREGWEESFGATGFVQQNV